MSNRTMPNNAESPSVLREVRPLHRALLIAMLALLLCLVAFWFGRYFTLHPKPEGGGQHRLAVLPFDLSTSDENIRYLSIGFASSIIERLSNNPQMRVSPIDRSANLDRIRKDANTDVCLTGTIRKTENHLSINAQLIKTKDGISLWSDHYDLATADLKDVEDRIADKVSSTLKITPTGAERDRIDRHYTQNSAAYDSYLRGRAELARYNKEGILNAVRDFESALSLDPKYAIARAALALSSAEMQSRSDSEDQRKQWGDRAQAEADKALQIDANLAEAHEALAAVYCTTGINADATIRESKTALKLNPNLELPHYYLSSAYYHLGLVEIASEEVNAGLQAGARNQSEAYRLQGLIALALGNYRQAAMKLEQVKAAEGQKSSDVYLARAYFALKKYAEAEALLKRLAESPSPADAARSQAFHAAFLAAQGDLQSAKQIAYAVANGQYFDQQVDYNLGCAYAAMQQNDQALLWLHRSMDSGFACYQQFAQDPLLQPLQSDSNFRQLLGELRDKWKAARAKYE